MRVVVLRRRSVCTHREYLLRLPYLLPGGCCLDSACSGDGGSSSRQLLSEEQQGSSTRRTPRELAVAEIFSTL
ncbi:hypothetical protein cyc_08732 [Cyclospora cayetanensis]|uniref:Uncharacterized protein n=1 Tax=Cyclospora cayetanensis TaxID=88456 RepID=A0A1D3D1U2_9EIME|nr:hypothetical protein cyc_08732 [Cyclospora cayetanensis]